MVNFKLCVFTHTKKKPSWYFPGGTVDKNLPANARDTGSVPDPGRSHTLWSRWACVPTACAVHQDSPVRSLHVATKSSPHPLQPEKARTQH